jgi:hypothetical protein
MTSIRSARREWLADADYVVACSLQMLSEGCELVSATTVVALRETTQALMFRIAIARRRELALSTSMS